MRPRKRYGVGFLMVFVAAVLGAALARQAVGQVQLPHFGGLAGVQQRLEELNLWSLIALPRVTPQPAATAAGETATPEAAVPAATPQVVVVAPATPAVAASDQTNAPPATPAPAADTPTPAPLPTATPPPVAPPTATPAQLVDTGLPFVAAGAVRHGSDGCPGASIRGVVRDSAGNPLAGVRLWRYDQWGNEQVVESKSGADLGVYDFPLGDTPNVHYVQVVDNAGVIASAVVQIEHRQGEAPDALCHWVDWRQR